MYLPLKNGGDGKQFSVICVQAAMNGFAEAADMAAAVSLGGIGIHHFILQRHFVPKLCLPYRKAETAQNNSKGNSIRQIQIILFGAVSI